MTYILTNENKEVVKIGNVKALLIKACDATLLTKEELKGFNIYEGVELYPPEKKSWESWDLDYNFIFNEEKQIFEKIVGIKERVDLEQFKKEKIAQIKGTHIDILREGYFDEEFNIRIDCEKDDETELFKKLQRLKRKNSSGDGLIDFDNVKHNYSIINFETLYYIL